MSEIGSEFWEIPVCSKENDTIPQRALWFGSGRMAERFVIEDIKKQRPFRSVAMPSWCCHTMIEPFVRNGVEVHFYPVYPDENGRLRQDLSQIPPCDGLFLVDYFGYSAETAIPAFTGSIIRDVTHSLFSGAKNDADYVFGSLRKWAGFWTGGYAWKNDGDFQCNASTQTNDAYVVLRRQAMEEKFQYLSGQRENKGYLSVFSQAEEMLELQTDIYTAADEDISAARQLNVELLCNRRRRNAEILLEAVGEMALFPELRAADCPLFVPILVPDRKRDAFRRHLIQQEIYCPVHWPVSEYHRLTPQTEKLYREELSLVCDQRYTENDMDRIVEAMKGFWRK